MHTRSTGALCEFGKSERSDYISFNTSTTRLNFENFRGDYLEESNVGLCKKYSLQELV